MEELKQHQAEVKIADDAQSKAIFEKYGEECLAVLNGSRYTKTLEDAELSFFLDLAKKDLCDSRGFNYNDEPFEKVTVTTSIENYLVFECLKNESCYRDASISIRFDRLHFTKEDCVEMLCKTIRTNLQGDITGKTDIAQAVEKFSMKLSNFYRWVITFYKLHISKLGLAYPGFLFKDRSRVRVSNVERLYMDRSQQPKNTNETDPENKPKKKVPIKQVAKRDPWSDSEEEGVE